MLAHRDRRRDPALAVLLHSEPDLLARFEIPVSIPGIGSITAIIMLAGMPEVGQLDNKRVASLAGLAPVARPGARPCPCCSRWQRGVIKCNNADGQSIGIAAVPARSVVTRLHAA
jgi:transposase